MPTITVPATMSSLNEARDYLMKAIPSEFAAQTSNVILVAEELLVNVFSYAYPKGELGRATVSLDPIIVSGEEKLRFRVSDWGKPFNPFEEVAVPDLTLDVEKRPIGGLGIYLIKQVSEKQSYAYQNGQNCIEILFGLTPQPIA